MPQLRQLSCSIQWPETGVPFQEYGTAYGDGVVETFIVIPDRPQAFNIHVRSRGFIHQGLSVVVFVDGNYQTNRNRVNLRPTANDVPLNQTEIDFLIRQKEKPLGDGIYMGREWRFDDHNIVLEVPVGMKDDHFDNLGTIEVIVLRCSASISDEATASPSSSGADSDIFNERREKEALTLTGDTGSSKPDNFITEDHQPQEDEGGLTMFAGLGLVDGADDRPHHFGLDGNNTPPGVWNWQQRSTPALQQPQFVDPSYFPQHSHRPSHSININHAHRGHYDPIQPRHTRPSKHVHFDFGPGGHDSSTQSARSDPVGFRPSSYDRARQPIYGNNAMPVYHGPANHGASFEANRYMDHNIASSTQQECSLPPAEHRTGAVPIHQAVPSNGQPLVYPPYGHIYPHCTPPPFVPGWPTGHVVNPPWNPWLGTTYIPQYAAYPSSCLSNTTPGLTSTSGVSNTAQPDSTSQTQSQQVNGTGQDVPITESQSIQNNTATWDIPNIDQNQNDTATTDWTDNKDNNTTMNNNENSWISTDAVNDNTVQATDNNGGQDWSTNDMQATTAVENDWNNTTAPDAGNFNTANDSWGNDAKNESDAWNNEVPGNDNNNNSSNAQVQATNSSSTYKTMANSARPLYGPHGQYYALKARSSDAPAPDAEEEPRYDVPQSVAEAQGTTKQVQPGEGYLYYKKRCVPVYIDTMADPYARFVFKYRTREQLKREVDTNVDTEPTGDKAVQELQSMDKQTLIDMLLRAKGALGGRIPSPPPTAGTSSDANGSNDQGLILVDPPNQEFLKYQIPPARMSGKNGGASNGSNVDKGPDGAEAGKNKNEANDWGTVKTNNDNADTTQQNTDWNTGVDDWNTEGKQQNNNIGWDGSQEKVQKDPVTSNNPKSTSDVGAQQAMSSTNNPVSPGVAEADIQATGATEPSTYPASTTLMFNQAGSAASSPVGNAAWQSSGDFTDTVTHQPKSGW